MNDEMPNHKMHLERVYPSSAEELLCSSGCGRRIIVQWQPFKSIVLEAGRGDILHSAVKGEGLEAISVDLDAPFPDDLRDQISDVLGGIE